MPRPKYSSGAMSRTPRLPADEVASLRRLPIAQCSARFAMSTETAYSKLDTFGRSCPLTEVSQPLS